jgi:hypothetical protein
MPTDSAVFYRYLGVEVMLCGRRSWNPIVPQYTVLQNVGGKGFFQGFIHPPLIIILCLGVSRSWSRSWSRPRGTESMSSCVLERTTNTHWGGGVEGMDAQAVPDSTCRRYCCWPASSSNYAETQNCVCTEHTNSTSCQ